MIEIIYGTNVTGEGDRMMDIQMDIKKSLERCIAARAIVSYFDCKGCVYFPNVSCKYLLMKDTHDLIEAMEARAAEAMEEAKRISRDNDRLQEAYNAMHRDLERMARDLERSRGENAENRE